MANQFFWHGRSVKLALELCHSYEVMSVIDLTMGNAAFAIAATMMRLPYCGIGLTEAHCHSVKSWIDKTIFNEMGNQQSMIYDASLTTAMSTLTEDDDDPAEERDLKKLAEPKKTPKRAAKKAAKSKAKAAASPANVADKDVVVIDKDLDGKELDSKDSTSSETDDVPSSKDDGESKRT